MAFYGVIRVAGAIDLSYSAGGRGSLHPSADDDFLLIGAIAFLVLRFYAPAGSGIHRKRGVERHEKSTRFSGILPALLSCLAFCIGLWPFNISRPYGKFSWKEFSIILASAS
jgi:hypothetical protein